LAGSSRLAAWRPAGNAGIRGAPRPAPRPGTKASTKASTKAGSGASTKASTKAGSGASTKAGTKAGSGASTKAGTGPALWRLRGKSGSRIPWQSRALDVRASAAWFIENKH